MGGSGSKHSKKTDNKTEQNNPSKPEGKNENHNNEINNPASIQRQETKSTADFDLPQSTSVAASVGVKFASKLDGIRSEFEKRKEIMNMKEFEVKKYMSLREDPTKSNLSDDELWDLAYSLDADETVQLKAKIDQDLKSFSDSLGDKDLFMKYFFKEITLVLEMYNFQLMVQENRFDKAEREECLAEKKKEWENMEEIPIKLLISDLSSMADGVKRVVMKNVSKLAGNEWALNHAGLQFGPYLIDWNNSELIIPRFFTSKSAVCLLPLGTVKRGDDLFKKVSEFCVEWNNGWSYNNLKNDINKKEGNCQFFVKQFMKMLNLDYPWGKTGPVAFNIKKIKNNEIGGEELKIWDEKGKETIIHSHDDLRRFYEENQNKPEEIKKEIDILIKSMERVFFMRYNAKKPGYEKYEINSPIFTKKLKKEEEKKKLAEQSGNSNNDSNNNNNNNEDEEEDEDDENNGVMQVTGKLV